MFPAADKEGVELEPNHTHFLLVDSGVDEFGGEIELRGKLEGAISKSWGKGKLITPGFHFYLKSNT